MKFSIKDFLRKLDQIRSFLTEEMLNGKIRLLYNACCVEVLKSTLKVLKSLLFSFVTKFF